MKTKYTSAASILMLRNAPKVWELILSKRILIFMSIYSKKAFKGGYFESFGVAEENIQSRIRGLILMAISNNERRLLLTTGNKSELAVGYAPYTEICPVVLLF